MAVPQVLHLVPDLSLGGTCRIMEHLVRASQGRLLQHTVAGLSASPDYLTHLQSLGLPAFALGRGLEGWPEAVQPDAPLAILVYRAGNREPLWDALFPELRRRGALVVMEMNIFGYLDSGPTGRDLDLIFGISMHNIWRHWAASGRPASAEYLERHRALYPAVLLAPGLQEKADLRLRMRESLGIPRDAFVIGDVCRPDPRKLDAMMPAILPRLVREVPELFFVARSFPATVARKIDHSVGAHFVNLPLAVSESDVAATYCALDAFVHMSTMGESFGMAVAEAMRCGLPVVANETPGRRQNNAQVELVLHERTGFLANTPVSVFGRVRDLARSPDLRRSLGEAGAARFLAPPLAPETAAEQLEQETLRLLAKRGTSSPQGGPTGISRQPTDQQMDEYLHSYEPVMTVRPSPLSLGEVAWEVVVNYRRLEWRVRRKLL